jgi:hypothetical protein
MACATLGEVFQGSHLKSTGHEMRSADPMHFNLLCPTLNPKVGGSNPPFQPSSISSEPEKNKLTTKWARNCRARDQLHFQGEISIPDSCFVANRIHECALSTMQSLAAKDDIKLFGSGEGGLQATAAPQKQNLVVYTEHLTHLSPMSQATTPDGEAY